MHPRHLFLLATLMRDQWRSREALEAIQLRRLRRLLRHAQAHVPYYRRLFQETGLDPEAVASAADLARLPITTRAQLQNLPVTEITADHAVLTRCQHITTSGSSGAPLTVHVTPDEIRFNDMVWTRASLATGRRLFDRVAYFKYFMPPRRWFERYGIWQRLLLSIMDSDATNLARLRALQPDGLRGIPFTLRQLAWEARARGIDDICPRTIHTTGALLDQEARALIEDVFHGEVFDAYGSTETGCLAWECPRHRGFHINMDVAIVQIEAGGRPCRPGEPGRVLATHLGAFTTPFIRYDLGDVATLSASPCPCGRGLPLLERLEGRADDFLRTPAGCILSPSLLTNNLKKVPGLGQFRVTQVSADRLECLVAPLPAATSDVARAFRMELEKFTGPDMHITVESVSQLAADASGKRRSICNRLPLPL